MVIMSRVCPQRLNVQYAHSQSKQTQVPSTPLPKLESATFSNKIFVGSGTKSKVYKWYDNRKSEYVALKEFTDVGVDDDKVLHEIAMNDYMRFSDRYPTYHGSYYDLTSNTIYLMNDFIEPGESLSSMRYSYGGSTVLEEDAICMFLDMCEFVHDCHSIGIMHRDIKLENFVYSSSDKRIYGIDLGLSKRIHENNLLSSLSTVTEHRKNATSEIPIIHQVTNAQMLYKKQNIGRTGTLMYMSPEMLVKGPYTAKTDIWSLGVCFYELVYGKSPFMQRGEWKFTNTGVSQHSLNKAFSRSFRPPEVSSKISTNLNDIILTMLNPVDIERPTIFEVYNLLEGLKKDFPEVHSSHASLNNII